MDKKYLAKIIATDNEGLQMISTCCAGAKVKISDIKFLQSNKVFLLSVERKKIGVPIKKKKSSIIIKKNKKLKKINLKTKPYPGFPTDLQAQLMVLLTQVNGTSKIKEEIFENRFMHVSELRRMGAHIETKGNKAKIFGGSKIYGAELMATDLRASVSLVLAGLAAKEKTIINRIYHLDRGYEEIENKLSNCGAYIKRLK